MRRIYYLVVCTICLITLMRPAYADTAAPKRGIAVLASSIGTDFTPEYLAELVKEHQFSPVVVDWAWITFHWDRTDFKAVNRFLQLMSDARVPVAAMYRPRFLSGPTVLTQMGEDGKRTVDHAEICYSDANSRKWGISWGEKILDKCPSFKEIIIYNPLNNCRCPKCAAAPKNRPYALLESFLSEARSAWRSTQSGVKLGVVYMPVPDFWDSCFAAIDVAHPFLRIRDDVDPARDVADIQAVQSIVRSKMGSCLGKVTWEEGAKVSIETLKTTNSLAARNGISYFFWTFDTLFKSPRYDPKAIAEALAATDVAVAAAPQKRVHPEIDLSTIPEDVRLMTEGYLDRMNEDDEFVALNELIQKAKESDSATRKSIISVVTAAMLDDSRPVLQRYQCCYVISGSGYAEGIPGLIDILLYDELEMMRSVAAEALADFPENTAARDALLQSAGQDMSQMVREVLNRRLGKDIPKPVASSAASAVDEKAPSGPPKPPSGPLVPVGKPLSWPFPGDYQAQSIFNNYQTATDDYIHCGLDFIHPAGTPVTAIESGHVAAMWTHEPHTGDFFIVTPVKGGNRGWCYTHLDPKTFTFKEGDFVQHGQILGKLVKFSPDEKYSMDHLHLHYVSFTKEASGQFKLQSLMDPLYYFDWKDTEPPAFRPLWFVTEGTARQFQADSSGIVTVSGKVDILAGITDNAYAGQQSYMGVPVVMLSISDGPHTMQKLVLDHRGDVGNEKQTKPLYLSREEAKSLANPSSYFPYYQVLRVTKTDGDGRITDRDATECWDTTAMDAAGKRSWPDGQYSVNVYAWDITENRAAAGTIVQVKNGP